MWAWLKSIIWTITIRFYWTGYKQVKILIKRLDVTDQGIFGHLTLDEGSFDCVTLERHDISIPVGTYKVTLYSSPAHNNILVPLLHGIPGREYIEIHWGNWEKDSKGCILVGAERDGDAIDNSRGTFDELMLHLKNKDDITVVIS